MSFTPIIDDLIEPILRRVADDRIQGLHQLQALAEAGNRSAVLFLGLYLSEEDETTDSAIPWLLAASDSGSPDAAWNLAMIARSRGSADEMRHWLDRAASLGNEDALEAVAKGYDVDDVIADWSLED